MDEDENELTGFGAVRRNLGRIQDGIDTYTGERADKPEEWIDDNRKVALRLTPPRERTVDSVGDPTHPQYIYNRRGELESRVKLDAISSLYSPIEIEEKVRKQCGLECCIAGPHDERAVAAALWPWEIACCYVAAQTIEGAEANSAAFWKWRGRLARDGIRPGQVMSFADADRLLRRAVLKGRVRVRQDSDLDAEDIPTSDWPRLAWETASNGEVHEFILLLRDGVPCYENPVLVAEEVKAWLQALARPMDGADRTVQQAAALASPEAMAEPIQNKPKTPKVAPIPVVSLETRPTKVRRGRRPEYHWDKLEEEYHAKISYEGTISNDDFKWNSKSKVYSYLIDWYQTRFRVVIPITTMKDGMKRLGILI